MQTQQDLTLNAYQTGAIRTAVYPNQGANLPYVALGLCGESGEVAEHAKKSVRDDGGSITEERREKLIKELGDVLWYVAACASEIRVSLSHIGCRNLEKLQSRQQQNLLHGSGSDREVSAGTCGVGDPDYGRHGERVEG